jgi:hypothetical protein
MLQIIILLAVVIGVVTALTRLTFRWTNGLATRDLSRNLHAGESIVNNDRIPESWLLPYRSQIARLRAAGKSDEEIERVGRAAHKHCLSAFDQLIAFFTKANVTNSADTRQAILTTLRERRDRWAAASWQELLAGNQEIETPG